MNTSNCFLLIQSQVELKNRSHEVSDQIPSKLTEPSAPYLISIETIWSYFSKSLLISRNFLNGAMQTNLWSQIGSSEATKKIQSAVLQSKLFSICSVPFNIRALKSQLGKINASFLYRDIEGLFLASLSVSIIATDIIDSLATFTNAALQTFASSSSQALSSLGMPIGFTLVALGAISRSTRMLHYQQFRDLLSQEVFLTNAEISLEECKAQLQKFFKEKLRLDNLKSQAFWQRRMSADAWKLLMTIQRSLESSSPLTPDQLVAIRETFKQIDSLIQEEMAVNCGYIATNVAIFASLCLFVFSSPSPLPYFLLAASWSSRIMLQAYQDYRSHQIANRYNISG